MSRVLQRGTAILAVIVACVALGTAALAQMPTSPWKKGAPFPEPDEELYGVTANGKLYVIGGWGDGKARGANYEYDPATDRWTKKQPMPRPAHHAALAAVNGKIYVFGGFVAPATTAIPLGAAWEPIADAYEFNPATDSWKPLAPLPGARGAAIAAAVDGKIYVIGGATTMEGSKAAVLHGIRARPGSRYEPGLRPGHEHVGKPQPDVGTAQSRIQRCRERQDLCHRRPHWPRLHSLRHQHGCGRGVQPRDEHVEPAERADAHRPKRRCLRNRRAQDLRRRR